MSLKIAMRLDAELMRETLYGDDRGLDTICWSSGGTMLRLEGRRRAFWSSLQHVSESRVTTSMSYAAACSMLRQQSSHQHPALREHVDVQRQLIAQSSVPLLHYCWTRLLCTRWGATPLSCNTAPQLTAVWTRKIVSWRSL
jgi:hypothetical protein